MNAMLSTLFFTVLMLLTVSGDANVPNAAEYRTSIVDVIEYGTFHYAKIDDGTLWFIAPYDEHVFSERSRSAECEIIKSYSPDFPYFFYFPDDGKTIGAVMIVEEETIISKTDGMKSCETYEFGSVEDNGHGLVKLQPDFYWSLEHPEDIKNVMKWKEGEDIFIVRVIYDTKTRYAPTGYMLYNIDREEEVLVAPAFI